MTDYSNASRTMLFNIHTLAWDADLCAALDIPPSLLPEPVPILPPLRHRGPRHPGAGGSGGHPHLRQRR